MMGRLCRVKQGRGTRARMQREEDEGEVNVGRMGGRFL